MNLGEVHGILGQKECIILCRRNYESINQAELRSQNWNHLVNQAGSINTVKLGYNEQQGTGQICAILLPPL